MSQKSAVLVFVGTLFLAENYFCEIMQPIGNFKQFQNLGHESCLLFHFSTIERLFVYNFVSQNSTALVFVETLLLPEIFFARSRNISGIVNNSDFWDTDPVYYFTSLLKNVSFTGIEDFDEDIIYEDFEEDLEDTLEPGCCNACCDKEVPWFELRHSRTSTGSDNASNFKFQLFAGVFCLLGAGTFSLHQV